MDSPWTNEKQTDLYVENLGFFVIIEEQQHRKTINKQQ